MYIDGPYGAFTSGCPSDTQVLIAGGVGITPMMSIIRTLADEGDKRPVILLYGSRDWDSITFREELEAIQPRLNLKVVHVLSDPHTPAGPARPATSMPRYCNATCRHRMPRTSTSSAAPT